MSRKKLIKQLKERNPKLNHLELENVINTFCESILNALKNGNNIEINFLKKFYIQFLNSNFTSDELDLIKMFTLLDFIRVLNYSKNIKHLKLLKIKIKHLYDNFNNSLLW